MMVGFNTNFRYRGVLFHVQTEDSGRSNPQILTHLYCGGTILSSEKCSYADQLDAPDLEQQVRSIMEAQHRALLTRLRRGEMDRGIEERLGPEIFAGEGATHPPPEVPEASVRSAARAPARAETTRAFGEGLISDKPLDEVVLEYLVENARKRKRPKQ